MSEWTPLTEYSQFLKRNPTKGLTGSKQQNRTEIRFPQGTLCRANNYRDLARTIIFWASLTIRQNPDAHPEPKAKYKLILANKPTYRKEKPLAIMNSRARHPKKEPFHADYYDYAAHYVYAGIPNVHFDLYQTSANLFYGMTEMLRLYRLPVEEIWIRRNLTKGLTRSKQQNRTET